jgi:solute carrier family 10 (sodium/bile acid cotransporter), member 7
MQTLRTRLPVDGFVVSLAGVVLAATLLPCRGAAAEAVHIAGIAAIVTLFFLQGARLSRDSVVRGMTHWRLHASVAATTFVLFPVIGLGLLALFPHLLPDSLWLGVLFLCALPSTVQSAIALTSIAQGNVPGAVCSATVSNIAGIAITPLLFGAMSSVRGGHVDPMAIGMVASQLLLPFITGQLLRPRLGYWAERNRAILSMTDRGSILLVVYGSFSAAVARGVWRQIPPAVLIDLLLLLAVLFGLILLWMRLVSAVVGFDRSDEAALILPGAQKSLVSGVPIASALISGPALGTILVPLMLYYPMQLLVCAWLARRYARREDRRPALSRPAPMWPAMSWPALSWPTISWPARPGVLNGISLLVRNGWSVPRPAVLIARDLVPGATDGPFERSGAPSPRQAEIR